MAAHMNAVGESAYPIGSLVPKAETGVLNFLQKYPDFDGRDVTIAIMDSGVDPCAAGLEHICDGRTVKVTERFDCSGCGDTDTSKIVAADAEGFIKGVSGRKLKLTQEMIDGNVSNGQYRVGLKLFSDMLPQNVYTAMIKREKEKNFNAQQNAAIAKVKLAIANIVAENGESKLSYEQKINKENLEAELEMLNTCGKAYDTVPISYDCVLYRAGSGWKAVIDTTQCGDLQQALHITEYSQTHEIKRINDYLSVSINVHNDGDVLEVVNLCSSHGTHVASIAAGNMKSRDLDGVAPNAQIISLTIGDGRFGSMETGTAIVRAITKIMQLCKQGRKVDVINMSYGEHAHWSHSGRVGKLMNELVNTYGVVWVCSAGNHGPALCTIGTPPDIIDSSLIGVGAYVSPQVMEAEYAMREKLPANVYTWTSRGPCIDGGEGVTICAPGSAIASVPLCTLTQKQHMNGTSMAAPHVAGAIALLISGLKQRQIPYSPYSIKRAISVTANKINYIDPFAQGKGLLNIEKAFEYLLQHAKEKDNLIRYSVWVGNYAKGIHLREGIQDRPLNYSAFIEPIFLNEKDVDAQAKCDFNIRLSFTCSQSYVQCGTFLDLSYSRRSLPIYIDPRGLPPGVHTALVSAYDTNCIEKGPVFDIPITIVQPHVLEDTKTPTFTPVSAAPNGTVDFLPNTIQRHFINVPDNATYAVLTLRDTEADTSNEVGKFYLHALQLLPESSCRKMETMKFFSALPGTDSRVYFKVKANKILEVCLAKYWSSFGVSHLQYNLKFAGASAINQNAHVMLSACGVHSLELSALGNIDIQPQVQLRSAVITLKPTDSSITPLNTTRDVIDDRQIYQNVLTYNLNVHKSAEVSLESPLFCDVLYESEFESQIWMLFDSNKKFICCGDAYSKSFHKLEKGEYTIKQQIRHENPEFLEKIADAAMLASFKLANAHSLDIFDNFNQCVISGKKVSCLSLTSSRSKILYVNRISMDKFSKANMPPNCAWLSGHLTLPKCDSARRVDQHDFIYVLPACEKKTVGASGVSNGSTNGNGANVGASKSKTPTKDHAVTKNTGNEVEVEETEVENEVPANCASASPKKSKVTVEEYVEAVRDSQCNFIVKCDLEKAEEIYNEVVKNHPNHLQAHLLLAQNIESDLPKAQFPLGFARDISNNKNDDEIKSIVEKLKRIVNLATLVINGTAKESLLAYYGLKVDIRADAAKIKTKMDKERATLLEAFVKKGISLTKIAIIDRNLDEKVAEIKDIYNEAIKFVDAGDSKIIRFTIWYAYVCQHYGRMYKNLTKLIEEKRTRDIFEEISLIAEKLELQHIKAHFDCITVAGFPETFRLF